MKRVPIDTMVFSILANRCAPTLSPINSAHGIWCDCVPWIYISLRCCMLLSWVWMISVSSISLTVLRLQYFQRMHASLWLIFIWWFIYAIEFLYIIVFLENCIWDLEMGLLFFWAEAWLMMNNRMSHKVYANVTQGLCDPHKVYTKNILSLDDWNTEYTQHHT